MKRKLSLPIIISTALITVGCSTTEPLDQELDYQSDAPRAKNTLEVPPDLTSPTTQNRYDIPGGGSASLAGRESPQQQTTQSNSNSRILTTVENAQIERDGNQRWLLIKEKTPEEIWPLLKAFWQDNGFIIKDEEPGIGFMETDWAENRAKLPNDGFRKLLETVGLGSIYSTPERDKFLIRMEKTNGGIEIYFSHRGLYETYTDEGRSANTAWQPRPSDPNLEAVFLGRFMLRLGLQEDQINRQLKETQTPQTAGRAKIEGNALVLDDNFDRAWRRVGLALDRVGLTIFDRDRSNGMYFVRPAKVDATEAKSGGFWSSLAFWRSDETPETQIQEDEYHVTVKQTATGQTTIQLLDKQGNNVDNRLNQNVLSRLQTELK